MLGKVALFSTFSWDFDTSWNSCIFSSVSGISLIFMPIPMSYQTRKMAYIFHCLSPLVSPGPNALFFPYIFLTLIELSPFILVNPSNRFKNEKRKSVKKITVQNVVFAVNFIQPRQRLWSPMSLPRNNFLLACIPVCSFLFLYMRVRIRYFQLFANGYCPLLFSFAFFVIYYQDQFSVLYSFGRLAFLELASRTQQLAYSRYGISLEQCKLQRLSSQDCDRNHNLNISSIAVSRIQGTLTGKILPNGHVIYLFSNGWILQHDILVWIFSAYGVDMPIPIKANKEQVTGGQSTQADSSFRFVFFDPAKTVLCCIRQMIW